jgi:hypothetical protein
MLKKLTSGFLLALSLVGFSSCDQSDLDEIGKILRPAPSSKVALTAVINGSQEVPPTPSAATGTFTGVYDKETNVLTYTVTYTGITPQAGHLHRGAPGTTGPIVVPFNSLSSPITGTFIFSEADEALLLNNGFYANLHTPAYPGGEIRGDIKKQ